LWEKRKELKRGVQILRKIVHAMFFDDSKPPTTIIMYEKSLPCGALGMSPHVVSSSGMLQVDLVETDHDLQNSMIDDQHMNHSSRLEHYQDQPVYHPYHDSSNGKRSGLLQV
jgi:hypothetical protein